MRKLIFGINVTLDGCCDHTKGIADDEVHDYFTNLFRKADVLVYGRKTYQLMVPFWPEVARNHSAPTKAINDFAQAFDAISTIVVFSRTLEKSQGTKTRIVDTDLRDTILKLKQEEGKDILVGGVDIPSQLIKLDLIDEYHIVVQPLIVGEGRRLFDQITLPEKLQLKFVDSKVFNSGTVALRYVK